MNETIKNMMELCNKYKFEFEECENKAFLKAKNTDGKYVKWIAYDSDEDTVSLLGGNTDNCNLWFHETRKDFTPEVCIQFITDINKALMLSSKDKFLLKDLIDPEDWQEIAGVSDACEDDRYYEL